MKRADKQKSKEKLISKARSSTVGVDWQMIRLMKESDRNRKKIDWYNN